MLNDVFDELNFGRPEWVEDDFAFVVVIHAFRVE